MDPYPLGSPQDYIDLENGEVTRDRSRGASVGGSEDGGRAASASTGEQRKASFLPVL